MKSILSILFCLFSNFSFGSNIVGTYIEQGKKLSIRIVDNPALYPFEAGRLWSIINSDQKVRGFVTGDLKITCDAALKEGTSDAFGSCRIVVSVNKLKENSQVLSYRLSDTEAQRVNSFFSDDPLSLNLDLFRDSDRAMNFTVDRMHNYFLVNIYKIIIE